MKAVTVPNIAELPDGLAAMLTRKNFTLRVLVKLLDSCSGKHNGCRNCEYVGLCRQTYDRWLDSDKIKYLGGVVRRCW